MKGWRHVRKILRSVKIALRWGVYVAAAAYVVGAAPLGAGVMEFSANLIRAVAIILIAQLFLAIVTAIITHLTTGETAEVAVPSARKR